jgi:hypothetical protein
MAEFKYEITEELGELSKSGSNTKEVNYISYGGREPVLDIRSWYEDESGEKKMSKGITLKKDEVIKLREILEDLDLEES